MTIFFTSDTHWFHRNILEYCPKRRELGDTVDDMNEGLIARWNQRVGKNDIVYHLGDFTLTTRVELIDEVLARLNGRIRLVKGNHDKWLRKFDELKNKDKFEWVRQYNKENFSVGNKTYEIVMMHYPFLTWDGSARGSINIHGHAHGGNDHLNRGTKRLDVGVDGEYSNLRPLSLEQVIDITADGGIVDHHDL
jgi:calcineurin-like phosphoesterase family protein